MGTPVRVATFNLENLDLPRKGQTPLNDRIAVLRPDLMALQADVLCVQEVSVHIDRQRARQEIRALDLLVEGTAYASFQRITTRGTSGHPLDRHNLVVLSRLPVAHVEQHWHDLVEPPVVGLSTTPTRDAVTVVWDRPVLEVQVTCADGRPLTIFNAHLRAPLAAFVEGQKIGPLAWRTTAGWAEGYYLAAVKRVGQALELRKHVDRVLDADAHARIVVAGDLNAAVNDSALRLLIADTEDTGNPVLSERSLVPLEERTSPERRYSVLHRGQRLMLDHLLASQAVAKLHVKTSIYNDGLVDEYEAGRTVEALGSLHAPLVAELDLPTTDE
jgi:endonuclease/exonuclease/phosphatase family metal-dependent hydrolase